MYGQSSTSKLIDPPLYHIKGKSVMKACWTDMPCNCWGEHCIPSMTKILKKCNYSTCPLLILQSSRLLPLDENPERNPAIALLLPLFSWLKLGVWSLYDRSCMYLLYTYVLYTSVSGDSGVGKGEAPGAGAPSYF